jgi:hypothetical protein
MKIKKDKFFLSPVIFAIISFNACQEDQEIVSLPDVKTLEITDILNTSATSGGIVTDDGNLFIIDRGVCWDIQPHPTTSIMTKTSDGQDTGRFESRLSDLIPNQKYYVRSYAINSAGTSYGEEIVFQTMRDNTIIYKEDGRTVRLGDPLPIILDLTGDGVPDYTIFVELTANSQGDRLYTGINPLNNNVIKSGPAVDENFLSMGLLVAELSDSLIDENLKPDQRWTSDFSALVIRNTYTSGAVSYEGPWSDGSQIVGIQHVIDGLRYFGWLRVDFDKLTEIITLSDYAYESLSDMPVRAGQKSLWK